MRTVFFCSLLAVALGTTDSHAEWDPRFGGSTLGDPGFDDTVYALVNDGATVYAAGGFWGVWWWNGSSWQQLGGPVASPIRALAVTSSHDIYAGGFFNSISVFPSSITANNIARWDGATWTVLNVGGTPQSTGVNQAVHALATAPNGADVYVGGNFTVAGGLARNYVALWDGVTFQTVANNLFNDQVYDILVSGDDVYFGGAFTLFAQRVAHYNGATFEFFNGGPNGTVRAVALFGGELYAAGGFTSAGGGPAAGIARYDGTEWHAVATSLTSNTSPSLTALVVHDGNLYVTGGFSAINGISVNNIARWNGYGFSKLATGVSGMVSAGASVSGDLWVGGGFTGAGAWPSSKVARWNGASWGFGGASDVVRDIATDAAGTLLAGDFLQVGDVPANRIARWDGDAWSALGSGVDGSVRCVASNGTDVYAGGVFANAGGSPAAGIARWNGAAWSALGNGVQGIPYDLALDGGDLYVAGTVKPFGTPHTNIARWDGAAWHGLGTDYPNAATRCIVVEGGTVYVGGDFTSIGASPINRIAAWDGASWSSLGAGMNGIVYGIAVSGADLYAVGDFTTAGGTPANRIARWNGASWSAIGSGLDGGGRAVTVVGTQLFVGGDFSTAGGLPAPNLARWSGNQWSGIGGGTDERVLALAVTPTGLYAGGFFRNAGAVPSDRIAFWEEPFPTPVGDTPASALRLEQNVPNPFNPSTTIRYTLDRAGPTVLRVYDVRGALVRTLVDATQHAGPHEVAWNGLDDRGTAVASGVYFARLEAVSGTHVVKMTVLK